MPNSMPDRHRKAPGRERKPSVAGVRVIRDTDYMKPKGFEDYLTITEMSRSVDRDVSWLRKLERDGKIPEAHRVMVGKLSVRLWSPGQRDEIYFIVRNLRRGRPPGS